MNSFYVYVIQEVKASATAPIKIGVSNHIDRRLACLQTGNPRKLRVVATFGPMSRVDAYGLEGHIHYEIANHHLGGEWFSGKALKLIFNDSPRRGRFPKTEQPGAPLHPPTF